MQYYTIEPKTEHTVNNIIASHLSGREIEPCNLRVGVDDEDQQFIVVGLCYKLSQEPIDPKQSLEMLYALQNALIESGDYRTAIIEHNFDDNQVIKGFERAC